MPELERFADFHFLRPAWLLGVAAAVAFFVAVSWRDDPTRAWREIIAPHLLEHLRVGRGRGVRFKPLHVIVIVQALACLGLAGPTWQREPTPFSEDRAPLLIALDLSLTMDAIDVQPTRLERAKQKIRDLLALRTGARTGLLAYAGSVHTVLPLTDDASILQTYLMALETRLMPVPGKAAAAALRSAERQLEREDTPGSILFVTDGIPESEFETFVTHSERGPDSLLVLAIGTSEGGPIRRGEGFATDEAGQRIVARLDRLGLEALAERSGAFAASATLDDRDVERLQRRIQTQLEAVREAEAGERWRDAGYAFVLPCVALMALWFRRGWTVRWAVPWTRSVGGLAFGMLLPLGSPTLAHAQDSNWQRIWLTPDQYGRLLFERGEYAAAAESYIDPSWIGLACYRAENWECAIEAFARRDTPEAYFNLGNAYARNGQYALAGDAYEEALARREGWPEAQQNHDLVLALVAAQVTEEGSTGEPGDPSFAPDEIRFDEKGKKGKEGEVDRMPLSDEQLSEMWLRGLQTTPADFLRYRFAFEAAEAAQPAAASQVKPGRVQEPAR